MEIYLQLLHFGTEWDDHEVLEDINHVEFQLNILKSITAIYLGIVPLHFIEGDDIASIYQNSPSILTKQNLNNVRNCEKSRRRAFSAVPPPLSLGYSPARGGLPIYSWPSGRT